MYEKQNKILKNFIGGNAEITDKLKKYQYRGRIMNIIIIGHILYIYFDIFIKLVENKWVQLFEPKDLKYDVNIEDATISTFIGSYLFVDTGYVSDEMIELHMKGKSPFKWEGFKMLEKKEPSYKDLEFTNLGSPTIEIPHMELERYGDSRYKSICPACKVGLLLVYRDQKTFILQEYDRCVLCGQRVKYTDISFLREREGNVNGI